MKEYTKKEIDSIFKNAEKYGGSNKARKICSSDPYFSFFYAYLVDMEPTSITRQGVLKDAYFTYRYACSVDKEARDDTRQAVLIDPENSFWYAYDVDNCGRRDVKNAIISSASSSSVVFLYDYKHYIEEKILSCGEGKFINDLANSKLQSIIKKIYSNTYCNICVFPMNLLKIQFL